MVKDEYNRLFVDPVYIYKNEEVQESVENMRNESIGFILFLGGLYMCVILLPILFIAYHSIPGFPEPKKPFIPGPLFYEQIR
jgi:hypothetical protein